MIISTIIFLYSWLHKNQFMSSRGVSGSGQSDEPDKSKPNQLNWFGSVRFIGSIEFDPIGTDQYSVRVSD